MSATATDLISFADDFAAKTNSLDVPDIHPAAGATIWHWLCDMRTAAESGRIEEVAKYARWVTDKVALERRFNAENEASRERYLSKRAQWTLPGAVR
jgi:hypothetical protein